MHPGCGPPEMGQHSILDLNAHCTVAPRPNPTAAAMTGKTLSTWKPRYRILRRPSSSSHVVFVYHIPTLTLNLNPTPNPKA